MLVVVRCKARLTYLHLAIDSIATSNTSLGAAIARSLVARICATLSVGTIACHMTSITTDAANDVRGEVALLGAVVFAMTDLTTYAG
jgi:hypothetical protein